MCRKDNGGTSRTGARSIQKIAVWYNAVSQSTIHDMRVRVMKPAVASREDEVAERIEQWRADYMKLQLMDPGLRSVPGGLLGFITERDTHWADQDSRGHGMLEARSARPTGAHVDSWEILCAEKIEKQMIC